MFSMKIERKESLFKMFFFKGGRGRTMIRGNLWRYKDLVIFDVGR